MDLITNIQAAFRKQFIETSIAPRFFQAPGRVNIIGEHTDYNDGFVLPAAINFSTIVAARPGTASMVRIFAVDKRQFDQFDLSKPINPKPKMRWPNYVRGMAKMLLEAGHHLQGVDMAVAGNVPIASGLSSSASFEMALGQAFLKISNLPVDLVQLALSGQKAENNFVGVNCGIMDQFIAALGQADHALLIDCRDLSYQPVPVPSDTAIVIVDSGVKRGLVDSEYNTRRQECEAAANHFRAAALRDVSQNTFEQQSHELPETIRQRLRHVITENDRTLEAAKMLSQGNLQALGPLMAKSHESMRDDFQITVPAIDILVDIMQNVPHVYGARMTGGGFGGCCVALAPIDVAPKVQEAVLKQYRSKTGNQPKCYICQASQGAQEVMIRNENSDKCLTP